MTFAVGSLVKARGREWVVQPESQHHKDLLVLRPLVGADDETTGVYLPLERVEPARFDLPDPATELGNHRSCSLLRDAVRLGFRSAAGPFRALGAIAVEPRPYQLVPLLMALRLDPVRLLIADDVGVGKSIEAALVLRELLDRGEIKTSCVLCPPHLAEQWHRLLVDDFHLDAALVVRSNVTRLERNLPGLGERSLFDHFEHTVVSLDYIKMETRRHELLRASPDLVIVDEAHTCAAAAGVARAAQQRHALLRDLAEDEERHLLLVTATPHSGKEEAFRSLLHLLEPSFTELPEELRAEHREHLARHFIQRQRGDVMAYLDIDTPFPKRKTREEKYNLSTEYRDCFDRVLEYCREKVEMPDSDARRRRVRWWGALSLLRALGSSPAAAVQSLRNRAQGLGTETIEEADDLGRRIVLDLDDETAEGQDVVYGALVDVERTVDARITQGSHPGLPDSALRAPDGRRSLPLRPAGTDENSPGFQPGVIGDGANAREDTDADDPNATNLDASERRRLNQLARDIEKLTGKNDEKLKKAAAIVRALLSDGFHPIVFCRFIPTVDYVADELRKKLKNVTVEAITGLLPSEERERRIEAIDTERPRVLVCTDCLSEGINLQQAFDAVLHYDLSWNPTRHEQREGRVDRYGQKSKMVRTVTFFGENNPIDGIVIKVLIRKHEKIRSQLGISVPVPQESESVQEAIFESLVLRENAGLTAEQLAFDFLQKHQLTLDLEWDNAAEREKRSRSLFAHHAIKVDEVRRELQATERALGGASTADAFLREALPSFGAVVTERKGHLEIDFTEAPRDLRSLVDEQQKNLKLRASFQHPAPPGGTVLTRTHPLVAATADRVWSGALGSDGTAARRCGVIRTGDVGKRTTLLLLRVRYHILTKDRDGAERPLLAEDVLAAAFEGSPERAEWIDGDPAEALFQATPGGNVEPELARNQLRRILDRFDAVRPRLDEIAGVHGEQLLKAHRRVRQVTKEGLRSLRVEHLPPADVLGLFVYLPMPKGGA